MPLPQITIIDLNFRGLPRAIAAYLLNGPGGPALVETGPASTLPAMQTALRGLGLQPGDIRHVLLTHIHLDHAGAAWWWAQQGARIHVHPVGLPHLADPSRLLASARRIYGDQMDELWGPIQPIPAGQLQAVHDGDVIDLDGLRLTALDTPGHARHHHAYQLGDALFAGDIAGVRLTPHHYMRVPSPPPEFELEVWHASVARLRSLRFSRLYLTHFGPLDDVAEHWDHVDQMLDQYAAFVAERQQAGRSRDEILADMRAWDAGQQASAGLDEIAHERYRSVGPTDMSVDGILRYWAKRPPAEGRA